MKTLEWFLENGANPAIIDSRLDNLLDDVNLKNKIKDMLLRYETDYQKSKK